MRVESLEYITKPPPARTVPGCRKTLSLAGDSDCTVGMVSDDAVLNFSALDGAVFPFGSRDTPMRPLSSSQGGGEAERPAAAAFGVFASSVVGADRRSGADDGRCVGLLSADGSAETWDTLVLFALPCQMLLPAWVAAGDGAAAAVFARCKVADCGRT